MARKITTTKTAERMQAAQTMRAAGARLCPQGEQVVAQVLTPIGLRGNLRPKEVPGGHAGQVHLEVTNDAGDVLDIMATVRHVAHARHHKEQIQALSVSLRSEPDHAGARDEWYGIIHPGGAQARVRGAVLSAAMQEEADQRYRDTRGIERLVLSSDGQVRGIHRPWDPEGEQVPAMRATLDSGSMVEVELRDGELDIQVDHQQVTRPYIADVIARDILGRLRQDPGDDPTGALAAELGSVHTAAYESDVYRRLCG